MGSYLIQSSNGRTGNFEAVVPATHGGGLVHLWRDNDNGMRWSAPSCFGGKSDYTGAALIQSNYGGNLEAVAVDTAGNLDFFWRAPDWSGPHHVASGVTGVPSLIQSRHGRKGNFEVVVPHAAGGLVHLWRDNDNGMRWSAPARFGGTAGYVGASVIQSNYGSPGNLEVVAVDTAGNLDFFWRLDRAPWTWNGPFRVASGLAGAPSLIQSRHGRQGNFEVVAPHRDGGIAHLWRDNDNGMRWSAPVCVAGAARYTSAALIQGTYGKPGNLEVLALTQDGTPEHLWRMDRAPWTWGGPVPAGHEVSFSVSECIYGWTAAYQQVDTHVNVRVQLAPDAGVTAATIATLQTQWQQGIRTAWNDRARCSAGTPRTRAITADVQWVTTNAHHVVRVSLGSGRENMGQFYVTTLGTTAAHEFGHMLGNPDEYADTICPARNPVGTGTIMDNNTLPVPRHYTRIAQAHCGHQPADAGPTIRGRLIVRSLESLDLSARAQVLGELRAVAAGRVEELARAGTEAAETEISLDISGGAPGSRYVYRLAVAADGTAVRQVTDETADAEGADATRSTADVSADEVAGVFAAAQEAGLLDDELDPLDGPAAQILPDSLVAVITVRRGDVLRRVVVPAVEPGDAPDRIETPVPVQVSPEILIPRAGAERLAPVLERLAHVEGRL